VLKLSPNQRRAAVVFGFLPFIVFWVGMFWFVGNLFTTGQFPWLVFAVVLAAFAAILIPTATIYFLTKRLEEKLEVRQRNCVKGEP
jgi:hypothetical protein